MAKIKQAPDRPLKSAREALEAYDRFASYSSDAQRAWQRHSWHPGTQTGDRNRDVAARFDFAADAWGKALRAWIETQTSPPRGAKIVGPFKAS